MERHKHLTAFITPLGLTKSTAEACVHTMPIEYLEQI